MEKYQVILTGRQIGQGQIQTGEIFNTREEAMAKRKRMNAILSNGEKSYYGMRYKIVKVN